MRVPPRLLQRRAQQPPPLPPQRASRPPRAAAAPGGPARRDKRLRALRAPRANTLGYKKRGYRLGSISPPPGGAARPTPPHRCHPQIMRPIMYPPRPGGGRACRCPAPPRRCPVPRHCRCPAPRHSRAPRVAPHLSAPCLLHATPRAPREQGRSLPPPLPACCTPGTAGCQAERLLYGQPTGPSPPHRLGDLVDRPCGMGVLNSPFHVA